LAQTTSISSERLKHVRALRQKGRDEGGGQCWFSGEVADGLFAECHPRRNWQTVCRQSLVHRVIFIEHSTNILPSANMTLGKKERVHHGTAGFAECQKIKHLANILNKKLN